MSSSMQETRERAVTDYLLAMKFSEQESARNAYTWLVNLYIPIVRRALDRCELLKKHDITLIPPRDTGKKDSVWEDIPSLIVRIHLAKALVLFGMILEDQDANSLGVSDIQSFIDVDHQQENNNNFSPDILEQYARRRIDIAFPSDKNEANHTGELMARVGLRLASLDAEVDRLEKVIVLDMSIANPQSPVYKAITWLTTTFFDAAIKYATGKESLMRRYAILPSALHALIIDDTSLSKEQRENAAIWKAVAKILFALGYTRVTSTSSSVHNDDPLAPVTGLMPPDDVFTARACLATLRFMKDERAHRDAMARHAVPAVPEIGLGHLFAVSSMFGDCEDVASRAAKRSLENAERNFEEIRTLSEAMNLLVGFIESSKRMETLEQMRNIAIVSELEQTKIRIAEMTTKINELDTNRREFERLFREATADVDRLTRMNTQLERDLTAEKNRAPRDNSTVAPPFPSSTPQSLPSFLSPPPPPPPGSGMMPPPPPPPPGIGPIKGGKLRRIPRVGSSEQPETAAVTKRKQPPPQQSNQANLMQELKEKGARRLKKATDISRQADGTRQRLDETAVDASTGIDRAEALAGKNEIPKIRGAGGTGFKRSDLTKRLDPVIQKEVDQAGMEAETVARDNGLDDTLALRKGNEARRETLIRLLTLEADKKRADVISKHEKDLEDIKQASKERFQSLNETMTRIYKDKLENREEDEEPPQLPTYYNVEAEVAKLLQKEEAKLEETLKRNKLFFERALTAALKQYPVTTNEDTDIAGDDRLQNINAAMAHRFDSFYRYINHLYMECLDS